MVVPAEFMNIIKNKKNYSIDSLQRKILLKYLSFRENSLANYIPCFVLTI